MRHVRRYPALIGAAAMAAVATSAAAQTVREENVRAEDIPAQPLRDLNLIKEDVPPLLIDVANDPYSAEGLQSCADIEAAIADLDAMLGPDADTVDREKSDMQETANTAGRLAKSFVGGLVPFRKFVREISGSRGDQRKLEAMVTRAMIRRGFLKGLGLERDCPWPARPAEAAIASVASTDEPAQGPRDTQTYVSQPVVQPTD